MIHEQSEEQKKKNISPEQSLRLENQSCMSTYNPETDIRFNQKEDKLMSEIMDKYSKIMNSGKLTQENLYLKKLRYHHPIFKDMSYNAFKMVFDMCEVIQIRKGEKLFKQDTQIGDFYFVMHGQMGLKYKASYDVKD